MTITLHVVPHTHWDREWYEPFETYRHRFVKVMDELLATLAAKPDFRHFNLDGQTALVEDYLSVRPERREEIARHVLDGRLAVGPWRILMDEFLCSPETIIRNLRQGHASAQGLLGRSMAIGYLPDMFGHISQMPQILRLAGIEDACVWRGVPRAIDRTLFCWEAPDGSRVRTIYLPEEFINARWLPERVEELIERAADIAGALAPFEPGPIVLAMNGDDHASIQPHLPALFAAANQNSTGTQFRIGSLEEYLADQPAADGLPRWHGELRSSARAPILMGVASTRVGLKQAEWRTSTELERYAEPLTVISGVDSGQLLDLAWRRVVESSGHDSITGCGIDAVAVDVAARYVEASRIARLVIADGLERIAARVPTSEGVAVVNPSPFSRSGVVEVSLPVPVPDVLASADHTIIAPQVLAIEQEIKQTSAETAQTILDDLPEIVGMIKARTIGKKFVNRVSIERDSITTVTIVLGDQPIGELDADAIAQELEAAVRVHPDGLVRIVSAAEPSATALVWVPEVPACGWTTLEPMDGRSAANPGPAPGPVTVDSDVLDNGLLRAEVSALGDVRITHLESGTEYAGLFALEDGGDAGDEYNYSPPEQDQVIRGPSGAVSVTVGAVGPLHASLDVSYEMSLPGALEESAERRAERTVVIPVRMNLALRAGEPFLRAAISIDNNAHDHRLRVRFPLPFRTDRSHADGAFDVVERDLEAESGEFEHGLPTFPCRRWVDTSDQTQGLAVFHRGTCEYELAENGSELAITLLRSVGHLSREGMLYRAGAVGPTLPTPSAQVAGKHQFELAVYPHGGDWRTGRVQRTVETYAYDMLGTQMLSHTDGKRDLSRSGSALSVVPEDVQLSAFLRENGAITCRVWNSSGEATEAVLRIGLFLGIERAARTNLFGAELAPLPLADGTVRIALGPWEIANIRLEPATRHRT